MLFTEKQLQQLITVSVDASEQVIKCREKGLKLSAKLNGSIVSNADLLAHDIIIAGLKNIFGQDITMISEEGDANKNKQNRLSGSYFLIDPIDGTTSFSNGGDFCINIAYVNNKKVEYGLIAMPMRNIIIYSYNSKVWSYNMLTKETTQKHFASPASSGIIDVFASYRCISNKRCRQIFHVMKDTLFKHNYFIGCAMLGVAATKYCFLIEKRCNLVLTPGYIMDWDIAAAVGILSNAGFYIIDLKGVDMINNFSKARYYGAIATCQKNIIDIFIQNPIT